MTRPKFATPNQSGEPVAHDYGNVFFRQPCGDSERLVIGPTDGHVQLLGSLASAFKSHEFYVLYVLLLSHSERSPGRYQSPIISGHDELQRFVNCFRDFFENDGRHHLWIASPTSSDLLVYDHHEVIYAYGNLDSFENVVTSKDFRNSEFWFPSPHSHGYEPANATSEDELIDYFDWQYFELQPGDEWD